MPFRDRLTPLHLIFSSRPCPDRVRALVTDFTSSLPFFNTVLLSSRPHRTHRPGPTILAPNASMRKDSSKVSLAEHAN
ncbi:hypothetical protein BOTBODRAFT_182307 [Botryobasidium botryosum FD-172 SS1]|uniref:Uncharacterized protein n=1 Tax=Botryobasidium botryosum (strain FD-172 SS1) TaxID=930990 RepID=A0A067LTY4_BOTB1|nr:hypothetical protein BOTBODRAFT_182307 [Botryobasidium botryosum FD-172 SS1]